MTGIKCTTSNCEHNCAYHCKAGIINIDKRSVCSTKQKRDLGILEQNKVNMEAGEEFSFSEKDNLYVQCDCVDCRFNKNKSCSCERIEIKDGFIKTKCYTREDM